MEFKKKMRKQMRDMIKNYLKKNSVNLFVLHKYRRKIIYTFVYFSIIKGKLIYTLEN